MKVTYHEKHDLLYIRLDDHPRQVTNLRVDDDIVLDLGEQDRIVGIEILDASKRVNLDQFLTATIARPPEAGASNSLAAPPAPAKNTPSG